MPTPHEIDVSTGRAAMVSVRQTPWHRLGEVLPEAPSLDVALRVAALDWEVELRAMHTVDESDGPTGLKIPNFRAVVRNDTSHVLGMVTTAYYPIQNHEAFGVLEPLLDEGLATIETCGSLRDGRDVWMLVKFAEASIIEQSGDGAVVEEMMEEVDPYGLLANNHAGERKVTLRETPVRVVCANTLEAAVTSGRAGLTVGCAHTRNVKQNLRSAASILFGDVAARYRSFAELRRDLKSTILADVEFRLAVLETAVPIRHLERSVAIGKDTAATRHALERRQERRSKVMQLWKHGAGHVGDCSAWEAYNGLAQAFDHHDLFAPRGDRSRLQGLYDGALMRSKRRVFSNLHRISRTKDAEQRLAALNDLAR